MDAVTVILSLISVCGALGTFYFGVKSFALEKKRRSLTWQQIESASHELLRNSIKNFNPDILVFVSGPAAVVANIAVTKLRYFIPSYMIMLEDRKGRPFKERPKNCISYSSSRWNMYIPLQLVENKGNRILIISDCVISGDTSSSIRELLLNHGLNSENIYFSTLVCSQVAYDSDKHPEYFWYINPHGDFYFPWGKWF